MSYNGRVHFGLIADARLIPDPDSVIRRFGGEFEKLLYLALMGNWDRALDPAGAEALLCSRHRACATLTVPDRPRRTRHCHHPAATAACIALVSPFPFDPNDEAFP